MQIGSELPSASFDGSRFTLGVILSPLEYTKKILGENDMSELLIFSHTLVMLEPEGLGPLR